MNKALGGIAKKRSRCKKGSRRWRKLQRARGVGTLYAGNPDGVRSRKSGRRHNQRMSQWEYGRDIDYLEHKSEQSRIVCFTGPERGTSSRCPECGHRQRPKGREWVCKNCGFHGHRDVVGSANMHPIAYGKKIAFPRRITYLRPGPVKGPGGGMKNRPRSQEPERSSRPGTGHGEGVIARLPPCCPGESAGQPPAAATTRARASQEAGRAAEIAWKPAPFRGLGV